MKIGEGEYKLILERILRPEAEWKKEMIGEWLEEVEAPKLVYILASSYQIAKSIYRRLYPEGRIIDLRYIRQIQDVAGVRNIEVIVSDERFPSELFDYILDGLKVYEKIGKLRIVYL